MMIARNQPAGGPLQEKSTTVGGIQMRWHEYGDPAGLPVVLVHGIPTGPALWCGVAERLRGARVMAWEMVGYAGSMAEGVDRDISVRRQAEYLGSLLDHLGIQRTVLAGHDLGGGVVQLAALAAPQRCAGILLTNSIGYDSWPIPSVKALRTLSPAVRRFPRFALRLVFSSFLRRGHDDQEIASEAIRTHWPHYEAHGPDAFVRQIRSLDVQDTRAVSDQLFRLQGVPARVVWGAADQFQKLEYGERFARDLGATLKIIENGRHFTPEDHADVIAAELQTLIKDASSRQAL